MTVRIRRAGNNQADQVERMAQAVAKAAETPFREGLRADLMGRPSLEYWTRYAKIVARGYLLMHLLGRASVQRKLRKLTKAPEPDNPPVNLTAEFDDDAIRITGLVKAPFVEAVNVFRRDIPGLQDVVNQLIPSAFQRSSVLTAAVRERAKTDLRAKIAASLERGEVVGLAANMTSDQIAEALEGVIGVREASAHIETDTRTLMMHGFNSGTKEQLRRTADAFPVYQIQEVHDSRTRGNPTGIYADKGKHWQMDGFAAAADDPIWDSIWPPNGWNCRGIVRGIPIGECIRRGWADDAGAVDTQKLESLFRNQRKIVADGLYPDPGFDKGV